MQLIKAARIAAAIQGDRALAATLVMELQQVSFTISDQDAPLAIPSEKTAEQLFQSVPLTLSLFRARVDLKSQMHLVYRHSRDGVAAGDLRHC